MRISDSNQRGWESLRAHHTLNRGTPGHKNIRNTLVYTHLVNWEPDGFVSKVSSNQKEVTELIEAGFEFVLQKEGLAYFRKRK